MMSDNQSENVDEYIASFPFDVQDKLEEMRAAIKGASELISYGMPAYKNNGVLVYSVGYKNHIGFYATPNGHKEFEKELSTYKQGKGSVQFPHDKPLPLDLITRIVRFRVAENVNKA